MAMFNGISEYISKSLNGPEGLCDFRLARNNMDYSTCLLKYVFEDIGMHGVRPFGPISDFVLQCFRSDNSYFHQLGKAPSNAAIEKFYIDRYNNCTALETGQSLLSGFSPYTTVGMILGAAAVGFIAYQCLFKNND